MNRLLEAIKSRFPKLARFASFLREQLDFSTAPERKRRNRIILALLAGAFILGSSFQLVFYGPRANIPIANNLVILFLVNINIILLLVVGTLVGRNVIKLFFERPKTAGVKKFQTKLVISFATFTAIPSILLFFVASGLITFAIDNWFNETVEKSLKDSLEVAESLYESSEQAVSIKASKLAQLIKEKRMLDENNLVFLRNTVDRTMDEYAVDQIIVYDNNMEELVSVSVEGFDINLPRFVDDARLARLQEGETITESEILKGSSRAFSMAPVLGAGGGGAGKILAGTVFITDSLDRPIVEKISAITKTFDDYKQLKLQKFPIKAVYEVTLLLVTLLIFLASIWYGLYLAREITVPIRNLAEATEKVSEGDLTVKLESNSSDEIGVLINSFNRMIEELGTSRSSIEASNKELLEVNLELDRRRQYIETVFAKIATGVISVDSRGRITTFNPSARKILKIKVDDPRGAYYEDLFDPVHLEPIRALIREMSKSDEESYEKEVKVVIDDVRRTLLVHVSNLKDVGGKFQGLAVVFDDLTTMINAQKTSAWRDIAQYMAHEIKNPLTPIQLNTERLIRHFGQDRKTFDKIFENSTRMIIQEVNALRTLLDEFRKFAQLPEPKPSMASLHNIINSVVDMFKDIKKDITVKTTFDSSISLVMLDAEQIRRVFRNLIENAIDAIGSSGEVEIVTIRDEDRKKILINVRDDGPGISEKDIDKVFLPYFSGKPKGSGLGLAIVNRIVADHEGDVKIKNLSPRGVEVAIELPAT